MFSLSCCVAAWFHPAVKSQQLLYTAYSLSESIRYVQRKLLELETNTAPISKENDIDEYIIIYKPCERPKSFIGQLAIERMYEWANPNRVNHKKLGFRLLYLKHLNGEFLSNDSCNLISVRRNGWNNYWISTRLY